MKIENAENLILKYDNSTYRKDFKNDISSYALENKKRNLKVGDKILFYGGYNRDILYLSEILGFNNEDGAYVLWDCYWFPLNLNTRKYKRV